jgi:AraC-like DNA-binding protein
VVSEVASDRSTRAAHPALRGLVTPYHGYHHVDLGPGVHHGLPSRDLTVVVAIDEPIDVGWMTDESSRQRDWTVVSGLHPGPALIRHTGLQHGVQFGLTPRGARALLGLPAGALATTMLPLATVLGPLADQLYDEVAGARGWEERFGVLDRLLLGRFDPTCSIRRELCWAWDEIGRSGGRVRVDDLADALGWSRRHLSGQFGDEFGLGPKQAARVVRFQSARRLWSAGEPLPLAEVAARCGYADQAHLTRDWRELAGYAPLQWRREEFPFLQDPVPGG